MNILVTGACGYKGHVLIPKLLNEGHEVVAFDIQWFGNFLEQHPNLIIVKGDVRNIEIEDNSQDLVICSEVLEHVPNFKDVLKECYRILKPGAVMLISVPNYLPESLCWKYSKEYMLSLIHI